MDDQKLKLYEIGRLKDLLSGVDARADPFLYHLPDLLYRPNFSLINPSDAVTFAELALKYDKIPLIHDALTILNRLVDPEDGSLIQPSREFFYENHNFFWKELGSHTNTIDVILHVFNRTIFITSLGKK